MVGAGVENGAVESLLEARGLPSTRYEQSLTLSCMLYRSGFHSPVFATFAPERGHHLLVPSVLRPVNGPYRFPAASTSEYQKCHMFILLLV